VLSMRQWKRLPLAVKYEKLGSHIVPVYHKIKGMLSDFIIEERKDRFSVFFFFYDIESHVRM